MIHQGLLSPFLAYWKWSKTAWKIGRPGNEAMWYVNNLIAPRNVCNCVHFLYQKYKFSAQIWNVPAHFQSEFHGILCHLHNESIPISVFLLETTEAQMWWGINLTGICGVLRGTSSLKQLLRWYQSSGSRTEAYANWPCSTTCFVWHISGESSQQLFGSVTTRLQ